MILRIVFLKKKHMITRNVQMKKCNRVICLFFAIFIHYDPLERTNLLTD